MRKSAVGFVMLTACFIGAITWGADPSPAPAPSAVVLRYANNAAALTADEQQRLLTAALKMLESSQFNSSRPLWEWDTPKMLTEYGTAAAGKHLLVTFAEPQTVQTMGGVIEAREILIGLNGSQYASSVHTIDENGRVVGHAKYSGTLCIEMLELARAIAGDPVASTVAPAARGY